MEDAHMIFICICSIVIILLKIRINVIVPSFKAVLQSQGQKAIANQTNLIVYNKGRYTSLWYFFNVYKK